MNTDGFTSEAMITPMSRSTEIVIAADQLSHHQLELHAPNYASLQAAIAACSRVDEIADIGDRAVAAALYYRQSQDTNNEIECSRIRLRAERRLGVLLKEMAETGRRASRGGDRNPNVARRDIRLYDLKIPRDRASRAQQLAMVPDDHFDDALAEDRIAQPRRFIKEWRESQQRAEGTLPNAMAPQAPNLLRTVKQIKSAIESERLPSKRDRRWMRDIGEDGRNYLRLTLPSITRYFERILTRLEKQAQRQKPKTSAEK